MGNNLEQAKQKYNGQIVSGYPVDVDATSYSVNYDTADDGPGKMTVDSTAKQIVITHTNVSGEQSVHVCNIVKVGASNNIGYSPEGDSYSEVFMYNSYTFGCDVDGDSIIIKHFNRHICVEIKIKNTQIATTRKIIQVNENLAIVSHLISHCLLTRQDTHLKTD